MNTTPTKKFRKAGTAAILGGTMLAGALFLPAVAGAQQTDGSEPTDTTREDRQERRAERRAAFLATLEGLGISSDAVEAGREAGQTLAQIAEAEGVGRADLVDGLVVAAEERLAEAVANGTITEDEAAEKLAGIADKIDERVDAEPRERRGNGGERIQGLADTLGLTVEELQAASAEGQTLAEIAAAQGISEADLVDALVAGVAEKIDAAVESGRIDADEAAEKLAQIEQRVTEGVNAEPGERPVGERIKERFGRNDRTRPSDVPADGAADTGLDA